MKVEQLTSKLFSGFVVLSLLVSQSVFSEGILLPTIKSERPEKPVIAPPKPTYSELRRDQAIQLNRPSVRLGSSKVTESQARTLLAILRLEQNRIGADPKQSRVFNAELAALSVAVQSAPTFNKQPYLAETVAAARDFQMLYDNAHYFSGVDFLERGVSASVSFSVDSTGRASLGIGGSVDFSRFVKDTVYNYDTSSSLQNAQALQRFLIGIDSPLAMYGSNPMADFTPVQLSRDPEIASILLQIAEQHHLIEKSSTPGTTLDQLRAKNPDLQRLINRSDMTNVEERFSDQVHQANATNRRIETHVEALRFQSEREAAQRDLADAIKLGDFEKAAVIIRKFSDKYGNRGQEAAEKMQRDKEKGKNQDRIDWDGTKVDVLQTLLSGAANFPGVSAEGRRTLQGLAILTSVTKSLQSLNSIGLSSDKKREIFKLLTGDVLALANILISSLGGGPDMNQLILEGIQDLKTAARRIENKADAHFIELRDQITAMESRVTERLNRLETQQERIKETLEALTKRREFAEIKATQKQLADAANRGLGQCLEKCRGLQECCADLESAKKEELLPQMRALVASLRSERPSLQPKGEQHLSKKDIRPDSVASAFEHLVPRISGKDASFLGGDISWFLPFLRSVPKDDLNLSGMATSSEWYSEVSQNLRKAHEKAMANRSWAPKSVEESCELLGNALKESLDHSARQQALVPTTADGYPKMAELLELSELFENSVRSVADELSGWKERRISTKTPSLLEQDPSTLETRPTHRFDPRKLEWSRPVEEKWAKAMLKNGRMIPLCAVKTEQENLQADRGSDDIDIEKLHPNWNIDRDIRLQYVKMVPPDVWTAIALSDDASKSSVALCYRPTAVLDSRHHLSFKDETVGDKQGTYLYATERGRVGIEISVYWKDIQGELKKHLNQGLDSNGVLVVPIARTEFVSDVAQDVAFHRWYAEKAPNRSTPYTSSEIAEMRLKLDNDAIRPNGLAIYGGNEPFLEKYLAYRPWFEGSTPDIQMSSGWVNKILAPDVFRNLGRKIEQAEISPGIYKKDELPRVSFERQRPDNDRELGNQVLDSLRSYIREKTQEPWKKVSEHLALDMETMVEGGKAWETNRFSHALRQYEGARRILLHTLGARYRDTHSPEADRILQMIENLPTPQEIAKSLRTPGGEDIAMGWLMDPSKFQSEIMADWDQLMMEIFHPRIQGLLTDSAHDREIHAMYAFLNQANSGCSKMKTPERTAIHKKYEAYKAARKTTEIAERLWVQQGRKLGDAHIDYRILRAGLRNPSAKAELAKVTIELQSAAPKARANWTPPDAMVAGLENILLASAWTQKTAPASKDREAALGPDPELDHIFVTSLDSAKASTSGDRQESLRHALSTLSKDRYESDPNNRPTALREKIQLSPDLAKARVELESRLNAIFTRYLSRHQEVSQRKNSKAHQGYSLPFNKWTGILNDLSERELDALRAQAEIWNESSEFQFMGPRTESMLDPSVANIERHHEQILESMVATAKQLSAAAERKDQQASLPTKTNVQ